MPFTADDMLEIFQKVDVDGAAAQAVNDSGETFAKLNRRQLFAGTTPDGDRLTPDYKSKYYANKKNKMNPKPGLGTPDLRVTGDFQDQFEVTADTEEIDITSPVEYAARLTELYGDAQIYGLNDENTQEYIDGDFGDALGGELERQTGINFLEGQQ